MVQTISSKIKQMDKMQILKLIWHLQVTVFGLKELETIANFSGRKIKGDSLRIVDIGCRNGGFTKAMALHFQGAKIVGLEKNIDFLKEAQEETTKRIRFIAYDVLHDDMKPYLHDADIVIIRFMLQHLKDYKSILKRVYGAMKKEAQIFAIEGVFAEHREDVEDGPFNGCIDRLIQYYKSIGSDSAMSTKLPQDFLEVGFGKVEQKKCIHDYSDVDPENFKSLILSYAAFIHKEKPQFMSLELVEELENYLHSHSRSQMYFTTAVTQGIKL